MNTNGLFNQKINELSRIVREWLATGQDRELQRFSAQYLTTKGDEIARSVTRGMNDHQILTTCATAIQANY